MTRLTSPSHRLLMIIGFLTRMFQLITREMQKYRQLKETLRSNFARTQTNPIRPDIEKIRNQVRDQVREEYIKKLAD